MGIGIVFNFAEVSLSGTPQIFFGIPIKVIVTHQVKVTIPYPYLAGNILNSLYMF